MQLIPFANITILFQFMHPLWDATYVRKSGHKVFGFQFMHPLWDATLKTMIGMRTAQFQFMHPLWDATAKYSIHIPIYTIFCIYCVILSSFISFTQSYLSIHLPLLVRISQCFYVRLRFAPASYSSLVQKT